MSNMNVLVVDDDEGSRYLLRSALEDNYAITEAASADEVFEQLEIDIPDLILLDINMPDISGYQYARYQWL